MKLNLIFTVIHTLIIIVMTSCTNNKVRKDLPNFKLAHEFGIDSTQLMYQYYQKYGFTDVCEDLRMVSKLEVSPKLEKKLPFTIEDLKIINSISNRRYRLDTTQFSLKTNPRTKFRDIELAFIEFITDSTLTIQYGKGEYQIIQANHKSVLKIYDNESKLLYTEVIKCDGI